MVLILISFTDAGTIQANNLTDGTKTKTMTEVLDAVDAAAGGVGTLQQVTDAGNTTTKAIITTGVQVQSGYIDASGGAYYYSARTG